MTTWVIISKSLGIEKNWVVEFSPESLAGRKMFKNEEWLLATFACMMLLVSRRLAVSSLTSGTTAVFLAIKDLLQTDKRLPNEDCSSCQLNYINIRYVQYSIVFGIYIDICLPVPKLQCYWKTKWVGQLINSTDVIRNIPILRSKNYLLRTSVAASIFLLWDFLDSSGRFED